jgi:SAM-dependent methyltransferase
MSPDAARYAHDLNAIEVLIGSAETVLPALPGCSYDLVTMWHVLEHLHDPLATLSQCRRVLKPGGVLMVEVPNVSSLCSGIFRSYWAPLEAPRHLYQFTSATLRTLLVTAGFQVRRLRGIASPQNMCASLNLALAEWAGRHSTVASVYLSHPVQMAVAFPAEWLLAIARLSCELSAVAIRPGESSHDVQHPINP